MREVRHVWRDERVLLRMSIDIIGHEFVEARGSNPWAFAVFGQATHKDLHMSAMPKNTKAETGRSRLWLTTNKLSLSWGEEWLSILLQGHLTGSRSRSRLRRWHLSKACSCAQIGSCNDIYAQNLN